MTSFSDRIRPWTCPACGKANISANKGVCPDCHEPRVGTVAAEAQDAAGQATRTYEGEDALQEGIAAMAAQGWRVQSQSSFQPRAGLGRIAAIGVGALVFKPPMKFVVTFTR